MVNQLAKTVVMGEVDRREYWLIYRRDKNNNLVPFDLTGWTLKIILYDIKRIAFIVENSIVKQDLDIATNACYYSLETASSAVSGNYLGRLIISLDPQVIKTKEFQWNVDKVPPASA